jgi:hypothetical protein
MIYKAIAEGRLESWCIGTGKRGIRITEEAYKAWQSGGGQRKPIETEESPSDGAQPTTAPVSPLPSSAMKALAGVRG